MKTGDIVRYGHSKYSDGGDVTGLVVYINNEGGTLKVIDKFGNIDWFVMSECEIINER